MSLFSTKIQIQMFHTKLHQNQIINEDFEIKEEGGWDSHMQFFLHLSSFLANFKNNCNINY